MNRIFILLSLIINLAHAQDLRITGRYVSNDNYVEVSDSTIEFMTSYGCCLLINIYGQGTYKIVNDSVYVTTGKIANGHGSTYRTLEDLPSNNQVRFVIQTNGEPISVCYVSLDDNTTNKIIQGAYTETSGLASLDNIPPDHIENSVVTISKLGYDRFQIPLNEIIGKSVRVNLTDYQVVREKQIVFKVLTDNDSTKLIGPFFLLTKEEKKEIRKSRNKSYRRMMVNRWPWQWRFKDTHVVVPTTFVKQ